MGSRAVRFKLCCLCAASLDPCSASATQSTRAMHACSRRSSSHAHCSMQFTMSSKDSMGGAGLLLAPSTTMLSRVRVSCSCSSVSASTRADGCHACGPGAAGSGVGDLAAAVGEEQRAHMPDGWPTRNEVSIPHACRHRMHALSRSASIRRSPCLSRDAELSDRPGRSLLDVPSAREGGGLPPPLLSRR